MKICYDQSRNDIGGVRPKGYDFAPFWSGIGYGFRETTGVYERIYHLNSK